MAFVIGMRVDVLDGSVNVALLEPLCRIPGAYFLQELFGGVVVFAVGNI